jgi:NAD(P)-dependent dehydrogenase (short-subunit alcohol dehydrogenase family)
MRRATLALLALLAMLLPFTAFAQPRLGSPTVLITGCNRGVGLELARQYGALGWNVIATSHHGNDEPQMAPLRAVAAKYPNVVMDRLDVTDSASIRSVAQKYRDRPIDVLLLNGPSVQDQLAMDPAGSTQTYDEIDFDAARRDFDIHTLGPMRVAQAFASSVARSKQKKIATITAISGSFAHGLPGALAMNFSADKAALNKYMTLLAIAMRPQGVLVGLYEPAAPGATAQEIGATGGIAPVDRDVARLIEQIESLDAQHSGRITNFTTGHIDPF